jgi:arginase
MHSPERSFALIGAPSSAGGYAPGQEKAPAAFRRHGLPERLGSKGAVADLGDVEGFRWRSDPEHPKAMNLGAVARVARDVAKRVEQALAEQRSAFILGGDCTVELGTVAGATADGKRVAVIYIDLDTDLNPPAESDGALDWTGVAHMLGIPGAAPELTGLGRRVPLLQPKDLLFFGIDNVSAPEARTMQDLGLGAMRLRAVKADPEAAGRNAAAWAAGFDRLLVHLDVDVLSFVDFPIAENVRRQDGLTLDELAHALVPIFAAPN